MAAECPSLFPLQEILLICLGCGGERQVPERELETIRSVEDFDRFMKGRLAAYACRCGAKKCDVRMLPNAEAQAWLREHGDGSAAPAAPGGPQHGP